MTSTRKFPLRLALYGVVGAYLVGDVFIFNGPLRHKIDLGNPKSEAAIAHAISKGAVARVGGRLISASQLERAVSERLWLEGKKSGDLPAPELEAVRREALEHLIHQELLRFEIETSGAEIAVSDEEIDERLRRLVGRFENKGTFETAMKPQGIPSEKSLRERIASQVRHERFLASKIEPAIRFGEGEAREWFGKNLESLALPERVEARHIFIPTLNHPPDEAKATLQAALESLTQKTKDFPTLAKELSQDPATKDNGGALGWMTRGRLPADFAAPVFSLEVNQPTLVRTHLGWHLVEVTGRKGVGPRNFEQAGPEIMAAMASAKRSQALAGYQASLRATHAADVEVFESAAR